MALKFQIALHNLDPDGHTPTLNLLCSVVISENVGTSDLRSEIDSDACCLRSVTRDDKTFHNNQYRYDIVKIVS
jgi:hypothetical protein